RERGRGGVDRVGRSGGLPVLRHEREVDVLQADLTQAGRVENGPVDRVLREAEDVHGGAPLRRVTTARADGDLPRRPRYPAGRVELQLHKRGAWMVGGDRW